MCVAPEQILSFLADRQHLQPHRGLGEVLSQLCNDIGACPIAVEQAADWLDVVREAPIGRLRRTELTQLARAIHRFWAAAVNETATVD